MNLLPENMYRRFLLGIASEEEESRVEDAVLAGEADDFFLQNAEDELIDDYLLGSMTPEEGHGFSANFLSTEERRQRLAFANGLMGYARKQQAKGLSVVQKSARRDTLRAVPSWRQAAVFAVAASVLLAALAGFELMQLRRQAQIANETKNELTRLQAALTAGNSDSSTVDTKSASASGFQQDGANPNLLLKFPPPDRGSVVTPSLQIPAQAQFVRIDVQVSLPLAVKYREVLVQVPSGDQLWEQEFPASNLPAKQQTTIVLPAPILAKGLYHFQVEKASADGRFELSKDYVFRVAKE